VDRVEIGTILWWLLEIIRRRKRYMTTALDQAVATAQAAEAAYNSDVTNIANIQAAVASASAPLAGAQTQLGSDTVAFVTALQAVSAAALAEVTVLQGTSTSN
jgi:hypothetical protein